jgi:hypothetical protein
MSDMRSETSPLAIREHWRQNKSNQLLSSILNVDGLPPELELIRVLTPEEKTAAACWYTEGDIECVWFGGFGLDNRQPIIVCDDYSKIKEHLEMLGYVLHTTAN